MKNNIKQMVFVKMNLGRKTFSGFDFFTNKVLFKDLKQIPFKKSEVIITHGNGNNIHPSLWDDSWFQKGGS